MWLNAAGVADLSVGSNLQFDLHMMATRAAIEGIGVALGLSPMVDDALADGRLVAPFDVTIPARDSHFVVTPEETIRRREVQLFKTWLLQEARSHNRPVDPKALKDRSKRRRRKSAKHSAR